MNVTITITTEMSRTVIDRTADELRSQASPNPFNLRMLFDDAVADAERAVAQLNTMLQS